jgi:hypothetical protein
MLRKFAAIVAAGILGVMASSSKADTDTYVVGYLNGVSPALASATISTSSGSFYAGQLNWSVTATNNATAFPVGSGFSTYCIDITDDIGIGGTYQFHLTSLGSATYLGGNYSYGAGTVTMVEAIDTLYSEFWGQSTTATNTYSAAQESAAFQGAVWDILFTPPVTINLGDSGANTLEGDELATLDNQLATAGGLDGYNVMALVAAPDGPVGTGQYNAQGQDQGLVVVPSLGSAPVPLPSTSMGGCVLLGLFGVGVAAKKRFSTAQ